METTVFLAKIIGPVLVLRGISIVIDRAHFLEMLDGLAEERKTVAFSMVPVALLMVSIALLIVHRDTDTLAGLMIFAIAIGGGLKSTALILFPGRVTGGARWLGRAGFLHVVWVVCLLTGTYFTWFGYFR